MYIYIYIPRHEKGKLCISHKKKIDRLRNNVYGKQVTGKNCMPLA